MSPKFLFTVKAYQVITHIHPILLQIDRSEWSYLRLGTARDMLYLPATSTTFSLAVSPLRIITCLFFTPKYSARSSINFSFAFPSTGGAVTLTR